MSDPYRVRRTLGAPSCTHPYGYELVPIYWRGNIRSICDEAAQWCEDQFGPQARSGEWHDRNWSRGGLSYFHFRNAVDAMAFKLRWDIGQ